MKLAVTLLLFLSHYLASSLYCRLSLSLSAISSLLSALYELYGR